MTKTCGKNRHAGNLVQNMSSSDKVASLIAKKMQRGGKMDFKGLIKQLAPAVAPVAGKAINAALSKAFSYGRKLIPKKHSQKLDLVKQLFNKANLGCRVSSFPGKNVRRDPANPTWDPRWDPARNRRDPSWDPARDYGMSREASHLGSQLGSHQSHLGSHLKSWVGSKKPSHLGFVKIPPIPPGIPPEIPGGITTSITT